MEIINYLNVGKTQRTAIEELNVKIEDANKDKKAEQFDMLSEIVDDLNPSDFPSGIEVKAKSSGISISMSGNRWSFIDLYIQDHWGSRDTARKYYVRHTVSSVSGNSNEESYETSVTKLIAIGQVPNLLAKLRGKLEMWAFVEETNDDIIRDLYKERRQLQNELTILLEMAAKENEKEFISILENGFDFGDARRVYTGYGDNYEYISNMTLARVSGKSLTVTYKNTWSDGTVHTTEPIRFKKEDLFEFMYEQLLTKEGDE